MKLVLRRAAVGAAAFFAASAFAAPAAFAADPADLGVKLSGNTMVLGTSDKEIGVSVTNHGVGTADGFKLTFDTSLLDSTKVQLVLTGSACDSATKTCSYSSKLATAENLDFPEFKLVRQSGASLGAAGKLKVSVSTTTTDSNSANDSATMDVSLSENFGVDLKILTLDVWAGIDDEGNIIPIKPGETATFFGFFYNQGSAATKGLRATITLPAGATFLPFEGCVLSEGDRKAVCELADAVLEGGGSIDDEESWFELPTLTVKVASTVAGPVNLTPGNALIEALGQTIDVPEVRGAKKTWGTVPSNLVEEFKEIDVTDNSDDFIVYVGGNGNLPKTGTNVMLIAGIGVGVLVAGGALFMITRRRRVTAA